ncbi:alginate export family protein [Thalassotalea marina]|uniref:Alginate export domain-containing protein n=1 Tax=Thalassotalea marina TaxID=1673741 RepID=A0A919BHM8_9GAMM|nr:alginate export family protein [Thalassotalea marina]GHF91931.1 hypothetical protein GCM10017161_19870 [Thalassotalea marina]
MKTSNTLKLKMCLLATAIASSLPVNAELLSDVANAVNQGKTKLNFRYRIESVDQQGIEKDALASTLRSRLSWQSGVINNLSVQLEVDHVTSIVADDYNSTTNGKTKYPVIADPEGTDLNQVNIKYTKDKLDVIFGRQRIVLGDQRFIGGVAWRQNEQTFDAARFKYQATDNLSVDYSYVFNVNRIFGPQDGVQPADWHGNFHLSNINWSVSKQHSITAFAYLFDNDVANAMSTNTFGVMYTGKFSGVKTTLSYATQSDAADNKNNFTANYYKAELATKVNNINLSAGIEVLGSDNGVGFSTPLATLHKFQGFADKFLGTPSQGIEDIYVSANSTFGKLTLAATYHDFSSNRGGVDYGKELNLQAVYKFSKHASGLVKYASYNADDFATDTDKVWAMINFAF